MHLPGHGVALSLAIACTLPGVARPALVGDGEPPQAANWLSNASFEEGDEGPPVDWVFFREHESTVGRCAIGLGRGGSRGASIDGAGGLAFGRWITPYRIPLEPNGHYRLSFWYRGSGGHVYVVGQPVEMGPDGTVTFDPARRFKMTVASPGECTDWTRHEGSFRAPGRPAWAQVCLSGGGRQSCSFDDVRLEKPGLTLVEPRVPQILPRGAPLDLVVYADELRDRPPEDVRWTTCPAFELRDVRKRDATGEWLLEGIAAASGALEITAKAADEAALNLRAADMVRVFPRGTERLFGVGAFTDAHFYRPGSNERNDRFAAAATTLNALEPLFAVSLGDQMEAHNGLRDEEKKWICEAVREQLARLSMPVFTVAGNHEVDRCYEGPGTRWYHEKYLGQPRFWGFRIGQSGFAGIDLSTPGIATREHGGSFLDGRQAAWLEAWLTESAPRSVVLAGHISPFGDWSRTPDRDAFLSLLLGGKVSVFLCGHEHFTADAVVPTGDARRHGPKPTPAAFQHIPGERDELALLTTTTVCAFPLGKEKTLGYRYLLMRDGRVAWQDVLPLTLSVTRTADGRGGVAFHVTNGSDKAVSGLPLVAACPEGRVTATLDGGSLPFESVALADGGQLVCVQLDVPMNASRRVALTTAEIGRPE